MTKTRKRRAPRRDHFRLRDAMSLKRRNNVDIPEAEDGFEEYEGEILSGPGQER
jgi:hypothetical protein